MGFLNVFDLVFIGCLLDLKFKHEEVPSLNLNQAVILLVLSHLSPHSERGS